MGKNTRRVAFPFGEADPAAPAVFGGKGAGLAAMARLGVAIPPGFTVTTSVARAYTGESRLPKRLYWQLQEGIRGIERATGKGFGNANNPLLVSVRSGAPVSMPGMMDTVLNVGLSPESTRGLAKRAGARLAWDCYRRYLAQYGQLVWYVPRDGFDSILTDAKEHEGVQEDTELSAAALERVCGQYRAHINSFLGGEAVTDDPHEQLVQTLTSVLMSWDSPRAWEYRTHMGIPHNIGTAVNVQAMVFGNYGPTSCTGVVFSQNVSTGAAGLWGEFLPNAQGEDVVAGARTPLPVTKLKAWNKKIHAELDRTVRLLHHHYGHAVDVEFTVEDKKLWLLQVRAAKLSPKAAVVSAVHRVWDGSLSKEEAIKIIKPSQLSLLTAQFNQTAWAKATSNIFRLRAKGLAASPGAAVGRAVLTSEEAVEAAAKGESVVLVRHDTNPLDLPGMLAAAAFVTNVGGATCHAAIVARELGKPAVVGCGKYTQRPGEIISVDGHAGVVVSGGVEFDTGAEPKEVTIFRRWCQKKKNEEKRSLNFNLVDERVNLHGLVGDFYLLAAMAKKSAGTVLESKILEAKETTHKAIAERLATYCTVAIAGELRHELDYRCEAILKLRREYGVAPRGEERALAQASVVRVLKTESPAEHVEFLALAITAFECGQWVSGYGGEKWANIARAVHQYLVGSITPTIFTDHAFDLQHNGGRVFDKHPMLQFDKAELEEQLGDKKLNDLKTYASTLISRASRDVSELYVAGRHLKLW